MLSYAVPVGGEVVSAAELVAGAALRRNEPEVFEVSIRDTREIPGDVVGECPRMILVHDLREEVRAVGRKCVIEAGSLGECVRLLRELNDKLCCLFVRNVEWEAVELLVLQHHPLRYEVPLRTPEVLQIIGVEEAVQERVRLSLLAACFDGEGEGGAVREAERHEGVTHQGDRGEVVEIERDTLDLIRTHRDVLPFAGEDGAWRVREVTDVMDREYTAASEVRGVELRECRVPYAVVARRDDRKIDHQSEDCRQRNDQQYGEDALHVVIVPNSTNASAL